MEQTGVFPDGELAVATCKKSGRTVVSDTSVGEEPRTSNMWVLLKVVSDQPMYATLTYADIDQFELAALPTC
jgi:hypothetical protein